MDLLGVHRLFFSVALFSAAICMAGKDFGPVNVTFMPGITGTLQISDQDDVVVVTAKTQFRPDVPQLSWMQSSQEIRFRFDKKTDPYGFKFVFHNRRDHPDAFREHLRTEFAATTRQPEFNRFIERFSQSHSATVANGLRNDAIAVSNMATGDTRPLLTWFANFFRTWSEHLRSPQGVGSLPASLPLPYIPWIPQIADQILLSAAWGAHIASEMASKALASRQVDGLGMETYNFELGAQEVPGMEQEAGRPFGLEMFFQSPIRVSIVGLEQVSVSLESGAISPALYQTCAGILRNQIKTKIDFDSLLQD